ncbi:CAAX prenyl protease-related protein [Candidatus Woesearchaeota archaeon]|nr:CAAX prenyl protease-related protein [Candidatus Woesearchaeota archaeon]
MWQYFLILFVYTGIFSVFYILTQNLLISLIAKIVIVSTLLAIWNKDFFKRIDFEALPIFVGASIAVIWIAIDKLYPHIPDFESIPDYDIVTIALKLFISIAIAPIVEEIFTRSFLIRWIIAFDYKSVPVGKFTWMSFIITVLFFGLAHDRWLAGIITGIALNLLLYHKKEIGPCILAHAVANLVLGIYVISTGSWYFW